MSNLHKAINKDKDNMKDFIYNDLSLQDQEQILPSNKKEMDEEYKERLDKKLDNMSYKKLKNTAKKFGYEEN